MRASEDIAARWKAEYGPRRARIMAKAMENQAKASGESETIVQRWKDVGYRIGGKP